MNVLVCGSRSKESYKEVVWNWLDKNMKDGSDIIHGGCKNSADEYANEWYIAMDRDIGIGIYLANWEKYGKSAGIRRNEEMLFVANKVVAFWDGKSKGTGFTIKKAKLMSLPVEVITI